MELDRRTGSALRLERGGGRAHRVERRLGHRIQGEGGEELDAGPLEETSRASLTPLLHPRGDLVLDAALESLALAAAPWYRRGRW